MPRQPTPVQDIIAYWIEYADNNPHTPKEVIAELCVNEINDYVNSVITLVRL